jgi:hypothetical protein
MRGKPVACRFSLGLPYGATNSTFPDIRYCASQRRRQLETPEGRWRTPAGQPVATHFTVGTSPSDLSMVCRSSHVRRNAQRSPREEKLLTGSLVDVVSGTVRHYRRQASSHGELVGPPSYFTSYRWFQMHFRYLYPVGKRQFRWRRTATSSSFV